MNIRAPLELDVVVVAAEDEVFDAKTIDLSAGGAGILCDQYLHRSRRLTLGVSLDDGTLLALPAAVASRDRTSDRRWRYGLRFVDLEDEQRAALTRQVMQTLAAAFDSTHA
jgi:c-di-GMP-binding flagellar brake protein YcgR